MHKVCMGPQCSATSWGQEVDQPIMFNCIIISEVTKLAVLSGREDWLGKMINSLPSKELSYVHFKGLFHSSSEVQLSAIQMC